MDPAKLAEVMRQARERLRASEQQDQHDAEIIALRRQFNAELAQARLQAQAQTLQQLLAQGLAGGFHSTPVFEATPVGSLPPRPPSSAVPGAPHGVGEAPGPAASPHQQPPGAQAKTTREPNATSSAATNSPGVPTFGQVVNGFLRGYPETQGQAMLKKHRAVLPLLLAVAGDKAVTELRQADINRFFDTVCRLPPRWVDECQRKRMTPVQLAQEPHPQTLSLKSFEDTYMACVRAFLKAARRDWQDQGFPTTLTTEGIRYTGTRTSIENRQRALRDEEIKRLFAGPELASFMGNAALVHQAWLPWIGLYTGARVNEICQLNPQCDIRQEPGTGIWYFDITEDSAADEGVAKSTKNTTSRRKVPIHSHLIDLGLLNYVKGVRKAGARRLFPPWAPSRGRASPNAEKWFRAFLDDLGLRDETPGARVVGMHAFRSTLLHRAHNHQPRLDLSAITGHADQAGPVVAGYQGELSLANKQRLLEQIDFRAVTRSGAA